jgi:hypothetical protein
MFLKEKISNFILLKTKNNYNWLPFLLTSNISYVFEHLDSIKNTHNDLNQISTIIDMNIIYNCSNVNYYINHNKYLNYALCNFINNFDNYKEFLTKNIFSYIDNYSRKPNNHNDSHIIKTYKPIIPKYEIKKENVYIWLGATLPEETKKVSEIKRKIRHGEIPTKKSKIRFDKIMKKLTDKEIEKLKNEFSNGERYKNVVWH